MKRFHVHVAVGDLLQSIRFYSGMFGQAPSVQKEDYAKWMLEDPRVNFAISARGNAAGVNHLGIQAENAEELSEIHQQLQSAGEAVKAEAEARCCYARSDKYWVTDPAGIAWESFHTLGDIPTFNGGANSPAETRATDATSASACCVPPAIASAGIELPPKSEKRGCCA